MGTPVAHEAAVSLNDVRTSDPEVESSKIDLVVEVSTNGESVGELETAGEVLTRVELDLGCASEKLINLNLLMMHMATKEVDFESFASSKGDTSDYSAEKALESDLLSGVLNSEVTDVDKLITNLEVDISTVRDTISRHANVGETSIVMDEKLCDCEKSLKQLKDQVSEIREQSTRFCRTFSCLNREENGNGDREEDGHFFSTNSKISMQTVEQQRHILRMLEKSLARELDLEKKVTESRQVEDELIHKLFSAEQEALFMEEEAMDFYERWFAAENAAEVFMGISKELLGRIQVLQFNLNGSKKREADLSSKLEKSVELLESKESALQKFNSSSTIHNEFLVAQTDNLKDSLTEAENKLILANSEVFMLREKVFSLEKQLKESEEQKASSSEISDMENAMNDLRDRLSKANSMADIAETKCALLTETNTELNEKLGKFKDINENVDSLERQLRESDLKLQHAVASADASQEKQNMLYSTIIDMDNLIKDLKSKLSKAESRADSVEDKCIILSESNANLNEELSFLRSRLESLEASLNQAEEMKILTAKDIGFRSKVITDLVMQLAIERERLHKQITSLALENRTLVLKLRHMRNEPAVATKHCSKGSGERISIPEQERSATGCEVENPHVGKTKVGSGDSGLDLEGTRRIDIRLLDLKHLIMAVLILLSSAAVYFFLAL